VSEHLGEDAELYALGMLDSARRAEVERHIAGCDACLERVGGAEATALALAAPLPRIEPSPSLRSRLLASAVESAPRAGAARAGRLAVRLARERVERGRLSLWGRLAAAAILLLALGLGFSFYRNSQLSAALRDDDLAFVTVVHSHFEHVTLRPIGPAAPAAKVLYAKDGSWIYVLVDRGVATLFERHAGKPSLIVLVGPGGPVASALLQY
jgi:anti-sigma factor RsiW